VRLPFGIFFTFTYGPFFIPLTIFLWNKYLSWADLGGRRWSYTIRIGDSWSGESTHCLLESGGRGEWRPGQKEETDGAVRDLSPFQECTPPTHH
jgi:hypothetical protein